MTDAYLQVKALSVALGGRTVLRDISFALERGQMAAIVGPNGAGKTTLVRALAGLVPASGDVLVGGEPLQMLSLRDRARSFAYLPQGHSIHWPLPVHDIVALGRYPHGATDPSRLAAADQAAVSKAMAETDVAGLADRPVTQLSGGERSRVILARVLAVEAPVILADEPTASLDPRYQIEVMRLLRHQAERGTLVVVVTHDLGFAARFADLVLVMNAGRNTMAGAPAEALAPEILLDVFRISAYRAVVGKGAPVIVPWSSS